MKKTLDKTKTILFGIILIGMTVFTSCTKSGDIGPDGKADPQGESGEPGSANVIYSDWISI